ncbi:DNA helicase [Tanacetum coccineum]
MVFYRTNQNDIRKEYLSGIYDTISRGDREGSDVGTRITLPFSFTEGPRYMYSHYLDALAIFQVLKNPQFFIKFTCNVNWPEVNRYIKHYPELTATDKADVVYCGWSMLIKYLFKYISKGTDKIVAQVTRAVGVDIRVWSWRNKKDIRLESNHQCSALGGQDCFGRGVIRRVYSRELGLSALDRSLGLLGFNHYSLDTRLSLSQEIEIVGYIGQVSMPIRVVDIRTTIINGKIDIALGNDTSTVTKEKLGSNMGEVKPEIGGNVNFEIKSPFMRELREDTFLGNENDDAHEHVERILDIVSLFNIPGVTHDTVMLRVFPITLTGDAKRWVERLPPGTINTWDLLK